jgi:glutaredoxin-related protein
MTEEQELTHVTVNGQTIEYGAAVVLMDDDIRERLHSQLPEGTTPQQFVDAYVRAHEAAFGETWIAN